MNRMMVVAAATLVVAAPQSARAARVDAAAPAAVRELGVDFAAYGVLQQGKGGGKQEDRGQGGGQRETRGGSQGGGRSEAQSSGERRQGGGQSDRAESGRGRSSSSSETRGSSGSSGRSDDARESRGNRSSSPSSRSERGPGNGSSASSGSERGRSDVRANATSGADVARASVRRRDRLSGPELRRHISGLSPTLRRFASSSRPSERMVAGAVARGRARGLPADAFDVRDDGGRLRVLNRSGALLLDLDDDRARDLGSWSLRRLGDRQPAGNAPAFCRSGAGHPVLGREWCLEKGFGLGSRNGTLWSRGGIDDVIWRRPTADRLDRGGLVGVLGDIIFGRLAFQAMTLGYDQPLVGYWVAQPEGPRILRVHSGDYEVAEFVDTDRDDRADVLYVVQPVW